ncbi:DUF305 domain-containing protein [Actinoplanes sp. GCM10030250]|uniref:DUF305 domain-containing protein n=1 Tax=Actinoplanes sp. GCM10030250 TaxID=3273376 RepID=UPI00361C3DDE
MNANPRLLIACAVTATLLVSAGCGTPPAPTAPSRPPTTSSAAFSGTDRPWIEINIAMAEELLPLLDLVPANSADPGLQQVAAQVRALTEQELATLRMLHGEAGLPSANPHKGMPMPGMVTPEKVAEAAGLRGARFDTLLRDCLREHLEQGTRLATGERSSGTEARTVALAESILASREPALEKLGKQ